MFIVILVVILVMVELVMPGTSYAWGPGIHVYIGASALEYVQNVVPAVAAVLESSPLYYLYGCLSADIFFGNTGKSTKRKCHTWEIGLKLLEISKDNHEKAYAYGFLTHLAADTVSHNVCLPHFMATNSVSKKWQHCFWEWQFDGIVPYEYRGVAREVFSHPFTRVDRILCSLTNVRFPVFWTKKAIYARTLGRRTRDRRSLSSIISCACLAHQQKNLFHLKKSLSLSLAAVLDVLRNPGGSAFLQLDPLGSFV